MRLQGMPSSSRVLASRDDSLIPSTVGTVAITNSVCLGSLNRSRAVRTRDRMPSSFATMSSWLPPAPNRPLTASAAAPSFLRSLMTWGVVAQLGCFWEVCVRVCVHGWWGGACMPVCSACKGWSCCNPNLKKHSHNPPTPIHLAQRRVDKVWQRQQAQRVASGRCVKHDAAELGILLGVDKLDHL